MSVEVGDRALAEYGSELLVLFLEFLAGGTLRVLDVAGAVVRCEGLGSVERGVSIPIARGRGSRR